MDGKAAKSLLMHVGIIWIKLRITDRAEVIRYGQMKLVLLEKKDSSFHAELCLIWLLFNKLNEMRGACCFNCQFPHIEEIGCLPPFSNTPCYVHFYYNYCFIKENRRSRHWENKKSPPHILVHLSHGGKGEMSAGEMWEFEPCCTEM